jgi:flagellar basal-body rod protein FlgC
MLVSLINISNFKSKILGSIFLAIFCIFSHSNIYSQSLDDAFDISTSGLLVQKVRLNIIAENLANVSTMRDENTGLPYRKKYVMLQPSNGGVKITGIGLSNEPFLKYFDPAVPGSDENGYFYYPNVDIPGEMVNLSYTEVIYEANITAFKNSKTMYQQAIELLR